MKYFIDTEFIEGFHKPLFGKKRHFIDLISIGIVCEDGGEYYAISNEFNYKDADAWVKKNVILPILKEGIAEYNDNAKKINGGMPFLDLKIDAIKVIQRFNGKNNIQIAREIESFIYRGHQRKTTGKRTGDLEDINGNDLEFYGYYADYDWVLFCSLFGRMIDLPKGFPMYCKDLKQIKDDFIEKNIGNVNLGFINPPDAIDIEHYLNDQVPQQNEHNSLADAKWNKRLFEMIQTMNHTGGK